MSEETKYPLCWPERWPRTNPASREYPNFKERTVVESWRILAVEMRRLTSGGDWFMSSNVRRKGDGGEPYANEKPTDPGVAVYFDLKGRKVSLASDKWIRVEDNIYALAKHIEALRGQDRWGVGTMEQAFRGYMALPGVGESSAADWWSILGVPVNADEAAVKEAYRMLAKKHHPDKGGDAELFNRITKAYDNFQTTIKNGK